MVGAHVVFQEVFDCSGRDFPPEWSRLHSALSEPKAWREGRQLARKTVDRWRNRTAVAWRLLSSVLLGQVSQRNLRGACVHGYCAAVHVALARSTGGSGGNHAGQPYWQDAVDCASWGGEWPTYHFLGESRWGSLLGEAAVSRPRPALRDPGSGPGRPTAARLPASASVRRSPPPASGLGLDFHRLPSRAASGGLAGPPPRQPPSEDRYLRDYRMQLSAAMAQRLPLAGADAELPQARGKLHIAAFGVHLTTLLEPVAAMHKVSPDNMPTSVVFHGSTHPLPETILQEVCTERGVPGIHCFQSTTPGDTFWMDITDTAGRASMAQAVSMLKGTLSYNDVIRSADCLVCGGGHAPVLCLLLRMVTSTPMFFNLQAPLTFRMPQQPDTRAILVAYFQQLARPADVATQATEGRTVVSTSLIFFQRQYLVQTGCLLPIVRNHNLYILEALRNAGVQPHERSAAKEVLFWQNHVPLKGEFGLILWRFAKQTVTDEYPHRLVFKNMNGLPGDRVGRKVYGLGAAQSTSLSYSAIVRRFMAAVIFPHDLGTISFDDLYALGVPLFMPADELVASMAAAHLSSTKNYPWYMLREEHAEFANMSSDSDGGMPWDPGWGGVDAVNKSGQAVYLGRALQHDPAAITRAVALSNYALFPHVRRFWSVAGLLQDLARTTPEEFAATSAAMRQSSEEAWAETSEFYRRSLAYLLGVRRGG